MPVSRKTNGSARHIETAVVSETVVLGTDENNTPAALVVDRDGIVDIEKLSSVKEGEHDLEEESKQVSATKPKRDVMGSFLKLARQPENLLIKGYYESNIRNKLLKNFEWYRTFEGEQELSNKLDNLYGGTNSPVNNLIHFVKNNILVSLILICLSFQFFTAYLSYSAESYRYTEKKQTSIASLQTVEPTFEPDYSNVLNHCAVADGLREFYGDTEDRTLKNKVTAEVEGFIKVYSSSDIEQWYADQQSKRDSAIAQIQSTLPRMYDYRDQIAAEISTVAQQHFTLKSRLDGVTTSGSQNLNDINNSIKFRTQLADLRARMKVGPSVDTLTELDNQLHRLNTIISEDKLVSTPISDWAKNTAEQNQATLVSSIRDIIDKDIDDNIEQASQATPGVRLYRLQIVVATLRYFGDLIGYLQNSPNYFEVQVGNKENSSNRRIRELLGYQDGPSDTKFLNYDNCLTALNTTPTKLTIH